MGFCYMAETNLGMARRSRFPERIQAAIPYFERKFGGGRYKPGSLHYSVGNAYSALGDEMSAKSSYQAAAGDMEYMADPDMAAPCLKNLGTAFERLGDEDMAAELYRGALEMNPQLPEAHLALGQYLHRKGLFEEALAHYDAVVFTERELGSSLTITGWRLNVLFNVGAIREAFRAINQLVADADREPWIWPWCARQVVAFSRTSVQAARGGLAFWQRYMRAHPQASSAPAELLLTQFYLREEGEDIGKDYAAFRIEFDHHIAHVEPQVAALAWDRLGHWAQSEGDWKEAERCFRQAYEFEGDRYAYCLGTALNALNRYEEALPLVETPAEGCEPDAMSWFQVGFAKEHLGRTLEAVEAYRQALVLDPDYSLAMFNLAWTLWNSGDHQQAAIVFRTAAHQYPDHDLTAKARRDLPGLFCSP
jgi:tetratricopeptide (TPR) repeat protein